MLPFGLSARRRRLRPPPIRRRAGFRQQAGAWTTLHATSSCTGSSRHVAVMPGPLTLFDIRCVGQVLVARLMLRLPPPSRSTAE